ncbi:Imm61 family immunity protein [Paenarthrobacter sp. NPDC089714]|uniref:Imm61 family immunity protein n=1 Tax=unclassified Paenarthrobacter TaxID=2634190 RepID=UPI0037FAC9EB
MTISLESLNEICSNLTELLKESDSGLWQEEENDSWYIAMGAEATLRLYTSDSVIVIAESDKGGKEFLLFESTEAEAVELFLARLLCMHIRGDADLPMLLVVPIPLTLKDTAPGFVLASDGPVSTLTETATGKIYRGDDLDLVVFSHYAKMTPREIREAYAAPEGKPPFFPLT